MKQELKDSIYNLFKQALSLGEFEQAEQILKSLNIDDAMLNAAVDDQLDFESPDIKSIKWLLAHGGNFKDDALFKIVRKDSKELIDLALKQGVNINAQDENGRTPLFVAALFGKADILDLLLKNGADPNVRDNSGQTAMFSCAATYVAYSTEHVKKIKLLAKSGADVNAKDNQGRTPIMFADKHGVEALSSLGADVNAKDNDGKTALLHILSTNVTTSTRQIFVKDFSEIVPAAKMLIKNGADVFATIDCVDEQNILFQRNLFDIAKDNHNLDVLEEIVGKNLYKKLFEASNRLKYAHQTAESPTSKLSATGERCLAVCQDPPSEHKIQNKDKTK